MSKRIEEIFNDCFERLLLGESLESCLRSYPEYAAELDSMLRTAFDIKRKAFPVQPRPEFKYWARIRMQNVQYYLAREPEKEKISASNLRRNLAFSLAALLVFVIASSGTAAASSQAMPDEPLYGVKMAVEQAQLTLTISDVDKAELYAQLAEKRAQEIAVMADKGKTDQVVATAAKLNYQLDQADAFLAKYQAELAASGALSGSTAATTPAVVVPHKTNIPVVPPVPPAPASTSAAVSENAAAVTPTLLPTTPSTLATVENATVENATVVATPVQPATQSLNDVDKAKSDIDASTDKSLSILQNALDKAPESVRSSLTDAIKKTRKARAHITSLQTPTENQTSTTSLQTPTENQTSITSLQTPTENQTSITSLQTPTENQTSTTSVTNTNANNSIQQQGTTNRSHAKHWR
jgi:hypothetical protein